MLGNIVSIYEYDSIRLGDSVVLVNKSEWLDRATSHYLDICVFAVKVIETVWDVKY